MSMPQPAQRAQSLTDSLPYVRSLHGHTVVIVCGGRSSFDPQARQALAQDVAMLALLGARPVLVHGGMPDIKLMQPGRPGDGQEPLRQVTRAALTEINFELVRLLDQQGVKAVGTSGRDAHAVTAGAVRQIGRMAEATSLDPSLLALLQANGLVPVLMPLAPDADGYDQPLAPEQLGSLLAQRLSAAKLVLIGDDRIRLQQEGIEAGITGRPALEEWLRMHERSEAADMVRAALGAIDHGVAAVHLVGAMQPGELLTELLTEEGHGTVLCRRTGPQVLADSGRYFQDCDSVIRPDFTATRKCVVRF
ncbi:acetylglutamate kinase [Chitinimonas koreensis]|uniref:acetylglutamate kinase n=1 Tax=Chitinimonas koreensis TaxID=356302 RepID=UPI000420D85D|nr:acetylglutamate kinase [Chitinimonas koreensis]QNM94719.1 acetylglutamate kinase [Chitinimonas koreensis]